MSVLQTGCSKCTTFKWFWLFHLQHNKNNKSYNFISIIKTGSYQVNEAKICYKKWVFNCYDNCVCLSVCTCSVHWWSIILPTSALRKCACCLIRNLVKHQKSMSILKLMKDTNMIKLTFCTKLWLRPHQCHIPVLQSYSRTYLNDWSCLWPFYFSFFFFFFLSNCSRNFYLPSWVLPIQFFLLHKLYKGRPTSLEVIFTLTV